MKLHPLLFIIGHALEIQWNNSGQNAKKREKKKKRGLSRVPMENSANFKEQTFEDDIQEEINLPDVVESAPLESKEVTEKEPIQREEISEEASCPVTINFGNRQATDPVFECIQYCLAYAPTTTTTSTTTTEPTTTSITTTTEPKTTESVTTSTTSRTTPSTTPSTTSTTTLTTTSTSTTTSTTTTTSTSTTTTATTTTTTSTTTKDEPTTTEEASTTSTTSATTTQEESSVWTTTTGTTSTAEKTTEKPATTTVKPTSTTLGDFQPLMDSIVTGLKTCANKSNFIKESDSRKKQKKNAKIIGGVTTFENDWPWLVYLEMGCGGTIIHEEWVLTAAHCCEGEKTITARFGEYNTEDDDEALTMTSSQIFIHPEYGQKSDGDPDNSDWCLVKFGESILQANDNDVSTQIACLPSGPIDHGEACWVAGWGDTEYDSGKYSDVILSAGVNILGPDYCQKYSNIGKLNIDDICAGLPDFDGDGLTDAGKDACQGDSGGPLICAQDGRATIVGVVSRGEGCGKKGQPGLYSSTWSAKDWIVKTVTKN